MIKPTLFVPIKIDENTTKNNIDNFYVAKHDVIGDKGVHNVFIRPYAEDKTELEPSMYNTTVHSKSPVFTSGEDAGEKRPLNSNEIMASELPVLTSEEKTENNEENYSKVLHKFFTDKLASDNPGIEFTSEIGEWKYSKKVTK